MLTFAAIFSMTLMRKSRYIIILPTIVTVLALMTACTKPDRDEEAASLSKEIVNDGLSDVEHSVERVDSAEQAGLFTAVRANTVKAIIYANADRRRLAAYYAEKAIAAEAGHAVATSADSNLHCKALWILGDCAYADGKYGKSLALSKEILAFVDDGKMPKDIEMKCRALSKMADCESKLGHIAESEQLFLQCIDALMASTEYATDYGEIDPLIYTLLSLNDLYVDNKKPEKALTLMAKMDTAMNRLRSCPNTPDWAIEKRRNNVTISKAMVYAANGQREQAEALHHEYQQFQGLGALDKAAEGLYLTMTGRYDEAVRLFDETDSMMRSDGEPVIDLYVKTLFNYKYDALQKAGRTAEALAMSDRIRLLTDSIRQQVSRGRECMLAEDVANGAIFRSKKLKKALAAKDKVAMEAVDRACHYLAIATGNMINTISPDLVLYGGGIMEAMGELFLGKILAEVDRYCIPSIRPTVELKIASLGDDSILYGDLALIKGL